MKTQLFKDVRNMLHQYMTFIYLVDVLDYYFSLFDLN